jgi:hypothetical protein
LTNVFWARETFGTADPSTSNLLALAKLYGVSAEELLGQVKLEDAAD